MRVSELINVLNKIENKELQIYVYNVDSTEFHEFDLDLTLEDRIDINISNQDQQE